MTLVEKLTAVWNEDNLLRRVIKNSSYLFGSNVISSGLSFIQTILAARLLGIADWGLVAVVQVFANNINQFLSFRMSEVVVKYLTPYLADEKKEEAAAVVKAAGLMEAATSVVAFLVLVLLAPWATRSFQQDISKAPIFVFYGLIILSNLVYETSTGVLQATHRYDRLATINLIQSIITLTVIGGTYSLHRWAGLIPASSLVVAILSAYVLGKTYWCVSQVIIALRELKKLLGAGWWKVPLQKLPGKRSMFAFAINTNLNGTVNIFVRDNIPLYLGWILGVTAVGYYKIAMTLIIPLTLILNPLIAPTYTELARTIAKAEWEKTLRLLRRITVISAGIVLAILAGWALIGWWLIPALYGKYAGPVYPLLLILIAGYGFASVFQWNRSLFLTLGKAGYPVLITLLTGLIELALMVILVPRYGYLAMGAILSGYFIVSIGFISVRGLVEVRRRQADAVA